MCESCELQIGETIETCCRAQVVSGTLFLCTAIGRPCIDVVACGGDVSQHQTVVLTILNIPQGHLHRWDATAGDWCDAR